MSIDLSQCSVAEFLELKAKMEDFSPVADTPTQTPTTENYIPVLKSWEDELMNKDMSESTITSYQIHVKKFFEWHVDKDLHSVTPRRVIDYRNYLLKMNLRPATINLKRISLSRFFEFCVENGILKSNPVSNVKKSKEVKLPPSTPSESDVNKMRNYILENCRRRNDYNHLMIFDMMRLTGIRVSEAVNLIFSDIDVDERTILIRNSKGNVTRHVPIGDELLESYKQFASNLHRSKNKEQLCFMYRGSGYAESSVRAFYHRIRKLAGIKTQFSPHSLRHWFCKSEIDAGAPLTHIASICGHSSIDVTAKYAEPNHHDLLATMNR